tara:strand:- start:1087 stop:1815 length:729 start_codon:yes stop_codon:yes gene_type:complete
MGKSITIVIPAFNEEGNIEASYQKTKDALLELGLDHEIFLVNDGSVDKTGEVIRRLESKDSQIRAIHHSVSKGIGYAYKTVVKRAKAELFFLMPGDDDLESSELKKILTAKDDKDVVIPYLENFQIRPLKRRFFSKTFTNTINFLFGMELKYYNGPVLHFTKNLREIEIKSNRYTYQAEILIRLIKQKRCSFAYVGINSNERKLGQSKAVKIANFIDVGLFIIRMFFEIYFRQKLKCFFKVA